MPNNLLAYTVKVSNKARAVRLAVYPDGSVVLTVPRNLKPGVAEKFLREKAGWVRKKIEKFKNAPQRLSAEDTKKEYLQFKQAALVLVQDRVKEYNTHYNLRPGKVSIKNAKTRWGSCSKQGNLSFNYKIVKLPETLQNYLVVHELCHLKEFNHSAKFWDMVSETIPNWKELRKALKIK
jgi:predicted metal-dependent hydrolase